VTISEQFKEFLYFQISWDGGVTWLEVPADSDLDKLRPTHIRVGIVGSAMYSDKPWTARTEIKELPGIDIRDYQ
jgi:hypothetical protein